MDKSSGWGMRVRAAGVVFACLFLQVNAARAATSEQRAAAQVLFTEGGQLFRQGKFEAACQKLAQSQQLDPATGTQLNLARCYEKVGKTASAWIAYVDVASAAKAAGQSEREETARLGAARLLAQVPKLLIQVPEGMLAPGVALEITRDNQPVTRDLWNVASPTDPGEHTFVAKAPNRKPWSKTVRLNPGEELTITLPKLDATPRQAPLPDSASGGFGTQHLFALSAAVVGLAGVGVGSGLGLSARSDAKQADQTCSSNTCNDEQGLAANQSAIKKANLATIFIGVGAACLAGGAALWFTAPSLSQQKANRSGRPVARLSPVLDANLRGVLLEGRF